MHCIFNSIFFLNRDECGRQKQEHTKDPAKFLRTPTPTTVHHITAIIQHLSNLTYFDMPDYELIKDHLTKLTEALPKTSCCRLFWRAPVPYHSRPDKEADLQVRTLFTVLYSMQ